MKVRIRKPGRLMVRVRRSTGRETDPRFDCGPNHREGNLYCMIGREAVVGCDGVAVPRWFAPYVQRRAVWNQIPLHVTVSVLRYSRKFPAALVDQLKEWAAHYGHIGQLTEWAAKRPTVREKELTRV